MATTWYVKTTGSDSTGTGTDANPYATPQKAHDVGSAGDTVIVDGGIYTATLSITKNNFTFTARNGVPRIYLGTAVGGAAWALDAGNVWKKTGVAMNDPSVLPMVTDQIIIFRPTATTFESGRQMDSKAEVTSDSSLGRRWFYDRAATTLYVYSTSDPTTAFYAVDKTATRGAAGVETGTYGGIYDTSTGLTLNGIAVSGVWGNGYLGYLCSTFTANDCEFSYNAEDGAGGHGGTNPIANRCFFYANGARRARSIGEILPNGDGWSWHATVSVPGTETTGLQDNYCRYERCCKDGFQHINASTSTSTGAYVKDCNFNVIFNISGGLQIVKNMRLVAHAEDQGGCGLSIGGGGVVDLYGCTLKGAGSTAVGAFIAAAGDVRTIKDCIMDNWDLGYFSIGTPTVENHNCWHVTSFGLSGTGSISTDPALKGSSLEILRSSPCFATGAAVAGLTKDAIMHARPATPSMGAMEPVSGAAGVAAASLWYDD